jgi:hypothetical protein
MVLYSATARQIVGRERERETRETVRAREREREDQRSDREMERNGRRARKRERDSRTCACGRCVCGQRGRPGRRMAGLPRVRAENRAPLSRGRSAYGPGYNAPPGQRSGGQVALHHLHRIGQDTQSSPAN